MAKNKALPLLVLAGAGLAWYALRARSSTRETFGPPLPAGYTPPTRPLFPVLKLPNAVTPYPDLFGGQASQPVPATRPPLLRAAVMNFSPDIGSPSGWNPPPAAEQYMMLIREVEKANGIPRNLYARLLEQESSWRRDYIYGPTTSPVGAQGIAQVMPATAAGAGYGMPVLRNPFDPVKAIPWGAKYLAALRRSLGSWQYALAAYNAGAGNVQKALRNAGPNWLSTLPRETQNYVADITGDVPVA